MTKCVSPALKTQVLHDAEKRKMYDLYGKEGVFASAGGGGGPGGAGGGGRGWGPQGFPGQGGMPQGGPGGASFFSFGGPDGGSAAGGSFGGFTDPRELFEGLFGGSGGMGGGGGVFDGGGASSLFGSMFGSPSFDDFNGMGGSGGGGAGRGGRGGGGRFPAGPGRRPRRPTGPPVEKEFWCSLRELYEGCEKKLKVTDTVTDPRTGQTRKVSHVYRIAVKPGWKEGTRVTFPPTREGLRSICFVLRQKRHRYLRREGDSLVYECRLTEDQARRGVRISVPLLSKADPPIELTTKGQDVYHNKEMLLPGLGMPAKNGGRGGGEGGRGSFKIKFLLQPRSGKAFAA